MNNGSRDTSNSDIQKLQQQLQDIKEQVSIFFINSILLFLLMSNIYYIYFRQCAQCV